MESKNCLLSDFLADDHGHKHSLGTFLVSWREMLYLDEIVGLEPLFNVK